LRNHEHRGGGNERKKEEVEDGILPSKVHRGKGDGRERRRDKSPKEPKHRIDTGVQQETPKADEIGVEKVENTQVVSQRRIAWEHVKNRVADVVGGGQRNAKSVRQRNDLEDQP